MENIINMFFTKTFTSIFIICILFVAGSSTIYKHDSNGFYTNNRPANWLDRIVGTTAEQNLHFNQQPRFYVDNLKPGDSVHYGGTIWMTHGWISKEICICPTQDIPCHCNSA